MVEGSTVKPFITYFPEAVFCLSGRQDKWQLCGQCPVIFVQRRASDAPWRRGASLSLLLALKVTERTLSVVTAARGTVTPRTTRRHPDNISWINAGSCARKIMRWPDFNAFCKTVCPGLDYIWDPISLSCDNVIFLPTQERERYCASEARACFNLQRSARRLYARL